MVKVLSYQSLIDIAVQTSGSAEAVFELAMKNELSITDELSAGSKIQTVDVIDIDIAAYYNNKRLTPATAINKLREEESGIFTREFNSVFM